MTEEQDMNELNEPPAAYGSSAPDMLRLDRNIFKATNAKEASNHIQDWKDRSYKERLEGAFFLICHAYSIDADLKMDRTIFEKRKR
jgi:hypothetical protein